MRPSGSRCARYMHALLTHLTLIHTIFLFLNAQVLELGRTDEKELSTLPRPLASLYTYITLDPAHDFGRFHRFSLCL